ncbi:MAG: hypothetical protein IT269_06920 [Saprospiraceae bacterium]|nr:hypothetical protein [Saprospiraceae bacterium]
MQQVILNVEESKYALFLQFLKTLDYVKVVQGHSTTYVQKPGNYNFSDIAGKLKWHGNALEEQRRLRNEW